MQPIGHIRSPFPEKFGIPRQAGLAPAAVSVLELDRARVPAESLRGLEESSHVWVIFELHGVGPREAGTVRPPRLGGNERLGVFATRSPFRPNPIGLSAVRLLEVRDHALVLGGGDFLDGTPVLDIKPYVPYADRVEDARCGWAEDPPRRRPVRFGPPAERALQVHPDGSALRQLIVEVVGQDPGPAYRADGPGERELGVRIADVNVRFRVAGEAVTVDTVETVPGTP